MKTIELKGSLRKETGKKNSKALRTEGNIPCVLYGGEENVHFVLDDLSFRSLIFTPNVYLIKLEVDGKNYEAVLQDAQYHPVTDYVIHADFVQVVEGKPVVVSLPVELKGNSVGIRAGGKLRFNRRYLKVKGLVKDLPETLVVDITKLNIGQSIKVSDLKFPSLALLDPSQSLVVGIITSRLAAKGMTVAEEEEEEVGEGETAEAAPTEEAAKE